MPRPSKNKATASKTLPPLTRETVLDKITGMYVLLKEVQIQQGHLQTSWDNWQETQRTNDTKLNARMDSLGKVDQALTDSIAVLSKHVTEVQTRVSKYNITERMDKHEKDLKELQDRWTDVEGIKRTQDQIRVQLRIQWVFLFILAIVGAYVFGYYQSKGIKPP